MPRFPKGFARRKSTANTLEELENAPVVEPSFKVFERPDSGNRSFDGGAKFTKVIAANAANAANAASPRTSHKKDNMFENLPYNRYVRIYLDRALYFLRLAIRMLTQ